jgi:D-arabinose 1-dehydrogenase-like Zn-dependent alcohol dehydrogenase
LPGVGVLRTYRRLSNGHAECNCDKPVFTEIEGGSLSKTDTLFFSRLSGVRAVTEVYPLERATEAYERMMSGKARFRVVLNTGQ